MASVLAAVLAIAAGLILLLALVRVVMLLRSVSASLSAVRLVLGAVARQTAPVSGFVDGIGTNVTALVAAVGDLSRLVDSGETRALRPAPRPRGVDASGA